MFRKRIFEAFFLFLLLLTLFIGLSLFSYNSSDPSYSNIIFTGYSDKVHNIFGKSGAYLADFLGTVFGWSSFIMPFLLVIVTAYFIKLYRDRTNFKRFFALTLSLFSFLLILSVISGLFGGYDPIFTDKISGGIFGAIGATAIRAIVGKVGGLLILFIFLFLTILGIVNLSLTDFLKKIIYFFKCSNKKERSVTDKKSFYKRLKDSITSFIIEFKSRRAEKKKLKLLNRELVAQDQLKKQMEEEELKLNEEINRNTVENPFINNITDSYEDYEAHELTYETKTVTTVSAASPYKVETVIEEPILSDDIDYESDDELIVYNPPISVSEFSNTPISEIDVDDTKKQPIQINTHIEIKQLSSDSGVMPQDNDYKPEIDMSEYVTVEELEKIINGHYKSTDSFKGFMGTSVIDEEVDNNINFDLSTPPSIPQSDPYFEDIIPDISRKDFQEHKPADKDILLDYNNLKLSDSDTSYNKIDQIDNAEPFEEFKVDEYNPLPMNNENEHKPLIDKNSLQAAYDKAFKREKVNNKDDETQVVSIKPAVVTSDINSSELIEDSSVDNYYLPIDLLDPISNNDEKPDIRVLEEKADILMQALNDFGVNGRIRDILPGPVVTMFEIELAPGVKINKISNLENDLALALSATGIRILAPIPGKAAVGIEVPNPSRETITLRELLESDDFKDSQSPLTVALGKDIAGNPYFSDLSKMPHLLVAGTTGSGKSVCVNSLICSILYKSSPDLVKFVLIDPKMVELSVYEGIPHLMAPVVIDPRKAAAVLNNVVKEMENRYALLAACRVKSILSYNAFVENNQNFIPEGYETPISLMPYTVVIVDEFADLMMVAGKDVEMAIARIAQMARAVGIHLVLATQRPSVNVITGLIKANMPSRISFKVSSKIDSRTIIDQNGAEMLLGKGDSLFIPPGSSEPTRIHGCFLSEEEVLRVVDELKKYGEPNYDMTLLEEKSADTENNSDIEADPRFDEALQIVRDKGFASISMIQRYLRIGYNRAARIVEDMEQRGLVSPSDGTSKPRDYLGD